MDASSGRCRINSNRSTILTWFLFVTISLKSKSSSRGWLFYMGIFRVPSANWSYPSQVQLLYKGVAPIQTYNSSTYIYRILPVHKSSSNRNHLPMIFPVNEHQRHTLTIIDISTCDYTETRVAIADVSFSTSVKMNFVEYMPESIAVTVTHWDWFSLRSRAFIWLFLSCLFVQDKLLFVSFTPSHQE